LRAKFCQVYGSMILAQKKGAEVEVVSNIDIPQKKWPEGMVAAEKDATDIKQCTHRGKNVIKMFEDVEDNFKVKVKVNSKIDTSNLTFDEVSKACNDPNNPLGLNEALDVASIIIMRFIYSVCLVSRL